MDAHPFPQHMETDHPRPPPRMPSPLLRTPSPVIALVSHTRTVCARHTLVRPTLIPSYAGRLSLRRQRRHRRRSQSSRRLPLRQLRVPER